jgi:hypothetical protein
MSMSNEEYLEEIMYTAYSHGIDEQVRRIGNAIMQERPYLDACDAYACALQELTESKPDYINK